MKKLVRSIALALAVVLVFGMTAFAAGSTSTDTTSAVDKQLAKDAQNIANNGGFGVDGKIGNLSETWLIRAQRYADAHNLGKVVTIFFFDSSATDKNFSCNFNGLKPGTKYCFLHYTGEKAPDGTWEGVTDEMYKENAWEVISATLNEDGSLTGFFKNFSPIGIAEGSASAAAVVAPKTGEIIALAVIMALIMIAGAVVCAKKARLQK